MSSPTSSNSGLTARSPEPGNFGQAGQGLSKLEASISGQCGREGR
jgi:hypothetical protein